LKLRFASDSLPAEGNHEQVGTDNVSTTKTQLLHSTADARLYQRLMAILEGDRGRPVSELARLLNVSSQSTYNWIDRFLYQGGEPALADRYGIGRSTLWTEEHVALLRNLLESSPDRWGYFANDWTVPLLQEQLLHWSGRAFSEDTVRRELHRLGYVWKRGRYRLAADPELEKKTTDPQADSQLAAPERALGRRRARPAAVPIVAGRLVVTRAISGSPD
jgi:transposase